MTREEQNYWTKLNRRRYSRRWMLGSTGAAATGLAGLALVGCGDDDDDDDDGGSTPSNGGGGGTPTATTAPQATPTQAASNVKTGGHFIAHMGGSPRSLDPHFDTFPYNTAVTTNTNNALLQFTPDLTEIVPDIAVSLPEQPDDLTMTFKIQPGVKWHDVDPVNGRDFTAEDVVYSLNRQMTDEPGKFQHAYFFLGKATFEATDNETVVVKTEKPFAPLLSYIASPWSVLVNREAVETYGDVTEHAVGTGPFIFTEWQKDVKITMRRNPNYWRKDQFGDALPYIDEFTLLIAQDPETAATLFIDGEVQATVLGINQKDRVSGAVSDANYKAQPSQFWRQFRMMPTTAEKQYTAPFDDIRVRQAIVQAQDAQQILDLVYSGDGVLTYGPILPVYENWALKEPPAGSEYDVANAKALLEAAGNPTIAGPLIWANTTGTLQQVAEVHKQQLAEIGVDLQLTPMELAAYYNQTYAYDYTFSSHTPLNNPDPDENLSSYFGRNSTFFKHYNEEIWAKIDEQAVELDFEARQAIVQEAQEMIVLDFPMKFLYTTNNHMFTAANVMNWFYSADLYNGRIHDVWLDA